MKKPYLLILFKNPEIIEKIANKFGSQSVIVSVDVKKLIINMICFENGKLLSDLPLLEYLRKLENLGAGEILLTSIDNEGKKIGYDLDLYRLLKNRINLPIIANGGASIQSFEELFNKTEIASACAGTTFVYFGPRKAVLINYPSTYSVDKIMNQHSIHL